LSDQAKNNNLLVLVAYRKDPRSLQYAGKEALLKLLRRNQVSLEYAADEYRNDKTMIMAALIAEGNPSRLVEFLNKNIGSIHLEQKLEIITALFANVPPSNFELT